MLDYSYTWVFFSLLAAFSQALRIAVTKQLSFSFTAPALTFFVNFAGLCITLPLIFWHHDFPLSNSNYLGAIMVGSLFSGCGGWSFNHAIKISEISIVGPLITITPGFVVIIEWLLLGAVPTTVGFIGIGLLMLGSYILSIDTKQDGWLRPLFCIVTCPGSRFALLAGLLFATASVLGRKAIQLSDPFSFAVMVSIINPLVLFILFSARQRTFYRELIGSNVRQQLKLLLLLGLLFAFMRIADQIALSMTLASYTMAVKRVAGLFTILIGHFWFKEEHVPLRLFGGLIMLTGVVTMIRG